MKLILIGAPGSGKGTIAELISKDFNLSHISTGQMFRDEMAKHSKIGNAVREYMDKGEMVPDEITEKMLLKKLKGDIILDGFPRNIVQAEFLSRTITIDRVIFFEVPVQTVMQRLNGRRTCSKCGSIYHIVNHPPKKRGVCDKCSAKLVKRTDETPAIIMRRLKTFEKETTPIISYYKKKKLLSTVNAEGEVQIVYKNVMKVMKNLK